MHHLQHCIENCTRCHQICLSTLTHCLQQGGVHSKPEHIGLLHDCAEICQNSANFMLRQSPLHHHTCGVCSEICLLCAQHCDSMAANDPKMRECAEICRSCAQSCAEMAHSKAR